MTGRYVDLDDVTVEVDCELGSKALTLEEASSLKVGEVIALDKLAGEAFDIRVNGQLFARGEIVVVEDLMAVRVTQMVDPAPAAVGA